VPDRRFYPEAKRAVATLRSVDERSYEEPRFFADGERVLVSRLEPRGDGSLAWDLSVWNYRRRSLRRVTRAAGVQAADPSPDGRSAAATRCAAGRCDLVTVDLASGRVTTLLTGTRDASFYRPRYSTDGRRLAVSVQQKGRWRVGIVDVGRRTLRYVGPDDGAARYDVAWLPDGRSLVCVSQRGGIPNLETLDSESSAARPLTRVTGAALAPEPNPADGSIWFLSLHSRGLDVRRIVPDSARVDQPIALSERLTPAAPVQPTRVPDTLSTRPVRPSRPYAVGPRQLRWFPGFSYSADGTGGEVVLSNADPIGRLALRAGAALGEPGTWRGGAFDLTWRRRAAVTGRVYLAEHEPSRSFLGEAGRALDVRMAGGDLGLELVRDHWSVRHRYRVGAALAWIDPVDWPLAPPLAGRTRALGYAELRGSVRQRYGEVRLTQAFAVHADAGGIGRDQFVRGVVSAALAAGGRLPFGGVQAWGTYGELSGTGDPFERFVIGGAQPPLVDDRVLAQRLAMPALPTGVATGDRVLAFRVALSSGPLSPYYFGASAADRGEPFERWHRVVGAELRLSSESIPLVALPEVQLVAGYGRSLDPPYRRGNRVYATLTYRR
ncbi:MAG: hypothetical protein M3282_08160, partial [Gemmatimonadota bacterium]|nr:hypothetical protein [Gemmatimonadota bacterium]